MFVNIENSAVADHIIIYHSKYESLHTSPVIAELSTDTSAGQLSNIEKDPCEDSKNI